MTGLQFWEKKRLNDKTYIHKHETQIFVELVPSVLPLLKEHIRVGHVGIVDYSV